jgi:hypothetical protein
MKIRIFLLFLTMIIGISGTALACSSDFSCRNGEVCVKEPYKSRGTCMTAVNEYGTKTYQQPRSSSVFSGDSEGQCRFTTDCPIGFKCDRRLKACVK